VRCSGGKEIARESGAMTGSTLVEWLASKIREPEVSDRLRIRRIHRQTAAGTGFIQT